MTLEMSSMQICNYCGGWILKKKVSEVMSYTYDVDGGIHYCPGFTRELQYLIGGQLK